MTGFEPATRRVLETPALTWLSYTLSVLFIWLVEEPGIEPGDSQILQKSAATPIDLSQWYVSFGGERTELNLLPNGIWATTRRWDHPSLFALPVNCIKLLAHPLGFEPRAFALAKRRSLLTELRVHTVLLVPPPGFAPGSPALQAGAFTRLA